MADTLNLSMTPDGKPLALLNETEELHDLEAVRTRADTADIEPLALARVVNEFSHGPAFRVIRDPDAFRAEYEAQIDAEDPDAIWSETRPRLRDYGVPDFDEITTPAMEGGTLLFYVTDRHTGLPYRVSAPISSGGAEPSYEPLPLQPLPGPSPEVPPDVTERALGPSSFPEPDPDRPPEED